MSHLASHYYHNTKMSDSIQQRGDSTISRANALRELLCSEELSVIVEAHDALSARLAQRAGLNAVWASSLTISATCGVRDANELTWTQVAAIIEHMVEATTIPILVDGDSGHGDFNTVRRFVRHLSTRGVAGVCFEDQCFPKRNSLVGSGHVLAPIDEFCGKLSTAKEAQQDDSFVVVARVEALIAGLTMGQALSRAEAYLAAGADAILIHSRDRSADQVLTFAHEWDGRSPLIVVPTTYSSTPVGAYRNTGVSALIWANHALRGAIEGMRRVYQTIRDETTPYSIEPQIASVADILELSSFDELAVMRAALERKLISRELGSECPALPKDDSTLAGHQQRAKGHNIVSV